MSVVFGLHVLTRMPERGTNVAEVEDVLRTGEADDARPGYWARAKVFPFGRFWSGGEYPEKKVRVIFVVEERDGRDYRVCLLWKLEHMKVSYDSRHDLLYLELDDTATTVRNEDLNESIVLDVDEAGRVAGIEILGASHLVNLARLLPVEYSAGG